jgi:aminopeptidase-like protein
MFHAAFRALTSPTTGFSGTRTFDIVKEIIRHHRIQASPGYRAAAEACAALIREAGVETAIRSYPANFGTQFWANRLFQEWDCRGATLRLVAPDGKARRLADYSEHKLSLVQRSNGTPPGGVTAEVVLLENGETEEEYANLDVRGKIVFTGGSAARVHALAVEKHGALGLITDYIADAPPIRERYDLQDALQYTSFWWGGLEETRGFGFVLTPREGDRLRRQMKRAGEVTVHATVDARLYDGEIEVVDAFIPGTGETDEEVVIVSHLCHPQPSANDNASGGATAVECARTLARLIGEGVLPRPRRGIRILLPPEMTGSYAYLATNEGRIPQMVAAINLDMVGENQDLCKGPMLVERPPAAGAGFAGDLLAAIMAELARQDTSNLSGSTRYALFKWAVTPFSGGSDHYIFADPAVGVPCPMLIQWPDKFYHTSADTLDKVDPAMLRRAGILTCAYAYAIAAAREPEALWLLNELSVSFRQGLPRTLADRPASAAAAPGAWIDRQSRFLLDRHREALNSVSRLADTNRINSLIATLRDDAERVTRDERDRARSAATWDKSTPVGAPIASPAGEWDEQAAGLIYRRLVPGPLGMHWDDYALSTERREELHAVTARRGARSMLTLALYWLDGRRTLRDVADLVEAECGLRDVETLMQWAGLLEEGSVLERTSYE